MARTSWDLELLDNFWQYLGNPFLSPVRASWHQSTHVTHETVIHTDVPMASTGPCLRLCQVRLQRKGDPVTVPKSAAAPGNVTFLPQPVQWYHRSGSNLNSKVLMGKNTTAQFDRSSFFEVAGRLERQKPIALKH